MIKPLEDKVLIKPIVEDEQVTESGLIIAGGQKPKPQKAVVISAGPGMFFPDGNKIVPNLNPGDVVFFTPYGGTEIEHKGENYIVLPYRDIFAVIEDDKA